LVLDLQCGRGGAGFGGAGQDRAQAAAVGFHVAEVFVVLVLALGQLQRAGAESRFRR
jgi:hypothetical protein